MQLTSILSTLSILGLSATGTSLPSRPHANDVFNWHATNFTVGCTPAACFYNFNVAAPGNKEVPSFNTTCASTDLKSGYAPCQNKNISSVLTPLADGTDGWNVSVKHFWINKIPGGEAEFWTVGKGNVSADSKEFDLKVQQQYGIA